MIDTDFEKQASKIIYYHKNEFDSYVFNKQKIHAIKALKEYTGGGLKDCKDVMDYYFEGKLKSYIVEERKQKLEMLAKKPLIEEISNKLITLKKEDFDNILMSLTVDELFNLDEIIDKNAHDK